jgi:uncharacterized protein (DUF2249 family)
MDAFEVDQFKWEWDGRGGEIWRMQCEAVFEVKSLWSGLCMLV